MPVLNANHRNFSGLSATGRAARPVAGRAPTRRHGSPCHGSYPFRLGGPAQARVVQPRHPPDQLIPPGHLALAAAGGLG